MEEQKYFSSIKLLIGILAVIYNTFFLAWSKMIRKTLVVKKEVCIDQKLVFYLGKNFGKKSLFFNKVWVCKKMNEDVSSGEFL